jgi:hypothetical protein
MTGQPTHALPHQYCLAAGSLPAVDPGEHIQGEKSSNGLNVVKETTPLFAMDRVIGGLKIQNQFFRRLFEGSYKLLYIT